jgi:hypothetical protein
VVFQTQAAEQWNDLILDRAQDRLIIRAAPRMRTSSDDTSAVGAALQHCPAHASVAICPHTAFEQNPEIRTVKDVAVPSLLRLATTRKFPQFASRLLIQL